MTNRKDAAQLASDDYRTRAARGIVSAMIAEDGGRHE
jgi:N-acetylmuramoyl-L-alanine amidase